MQQSLLSVYSSSPTLPTPERAISVCSWASVAAMQIYPPLSLSKATTSGVTPEEVSQMGYSLCSLLLEAYMRVRHSCRRSTLHTRQVSGAPLQHNFGSSSYVLSCSSTFGGRTAPLIKKGRSYRKRLLFAIRADTGCRQSWYIQLVFPNTSRRPPPISRQRRST